MAVKTLKDLDLKNKKVLVRVDFNVPLKGGVVRDDSRIKAALPTIEYILAQSGASVILISHLGRPKREDKAKDKADFTLAPAAERLSELLKRKVMMADDCIGEEVEAQAAALKPGDILMLENVRFHKEEEKNDHGFAKKLASLGDVYVNDAFGTAHRAHASTEGIAKYLPSAAGFLIEKEVKFFEPLLTSPAKPFAAIIGGAKVSSKIGVLRSLLKTCDVIVIGGAMAYTFLKVQDRKVGNSLVENDFTGTAEDFLKEAEKKKVKVVLPVDHIVADKFEEGAEPELIKGADIPDGKIGMDIGPETVKLIRGALEDAATIVWNGPLGVFEFDSFSKGTLEIAKAIAETKAVTIVGGGDSVAAVNKFGLADKLSHVSTGGGASLEFLQGLTLPGIAALEK